MRNDELTYGLTENGGDMECYDGESGATIGQYKGVRGIVTRPNQQWRETIIETIKELMANVDETGTSVKDVNLMELN